MGELIPEFERTTGHKVVATFETTQNIMSRIKAGESADVLILFRPSVDELKKTGKLVPGSETDLARMT